MPVLCIPARSELRMARTTVGPRDPARPLIVNLAGGELGRAALASILVRDSLEWRQTGGHWLIPGTVLTTAGSSGKPFEPATWTSAKLQSELRHGLQRFSLASSAVNDSNGLLLSVGDVLGSYAF